MSLEPRPHGRSSAELISMLHAVRSCAADTGDATTQHMLDGALVALEDALIRLDGPCGDGSAVSAVPTRNQGVR